MTVIALLRGINVGGHNRLPMADLRAIAVGCGHPEACTHLQSGNLVLPDADDDPADIERTLSAAIADHTGLTVPVIARTATEWARIVADNPYPSEAAADPTRVVVTFLPAPATPELRAFDAGTYAPERALVTETEIYLSLPDGQGRSTLVATLSSLDNAGTGTTRNWRTVLALAELSKP